MVRMRKAVFPNNPNWGGGWGWALFKADAPLVNISKDWTKDCRDCHVPAQETDWVFIEGYPTLGKPLPCSTLQETVDLRQASGS